MEGKTILHFNPVVIKHVLENHHSEAISGSRKKDVVKRKIFISNTLLSMDYPLQSVADFLNLSDHTSIMYHRKKHNNKMRFERYKKDFERFSNSFIHQLGEYAS